jgi:hypothetical protein
MGKRLAGGGAPFGRSNASGASVASAHRAAQWLSDLFCQA